MLCEHKLWLPAANGAMHLLIAAEPAFQRGAARRKRAFFQQRAGVVTAKLCQICMNGHAVGAAENAVKLPLAQEKLRTQILNGKRRPKIDVEIAFDAKRRRVCVLFSGKHLGSFCFR